MGTLVICYAEPGGKPLSVATVEDPDLLLRAARLAIRQAEQRAALAAKSSPLMGRLQAAELARVRAALELLVPGLAASPAGLV